MNKKPNIATKLIVVQVVTILAFALALMILFPLFIEKRAEVSAISSAQSMARQFTLVRKYYTENVIKKVLDNDTGLVPHINHKSMPNGIPLPASFLHDLSDLMQEDNVSLKFYSLYPFSNRKNRHIDAFGVNAWDALNNNPELPFVSYGQNSIPHIVRVAVSDIMVNQICVDCHNSHPMSPKRDWKVGDVRGVLEVTRDISVEVAEGIFAGRILALALVLVFGIIVIFSFRKQRLEYQKSADVIGEKNRELAFQKFALDKHAIVSISNVQGDITYVNNKFCEVSEYTEEELMGQNHRIVKSDEHPAQFYKDIWKTISNGDVWQGEIKNKAKSGKGYWVMTTIVPFLDKKGKPFQYISIRTDVTKRMEAEVRARTASRTKSDLMANMSHELRTPLNAIIGFSGTIRSEIFGPLGNKKYNEYVDDIHDSGQHLLELINDVLDVSAIEAGAIDLQEENISIPNVFNASTRIIQPRADKGKITITSSISSDMQMIYADERRIKQILLNLLSNAIKFSPKGGEVMIEASLNDHGLPSIVVTDKGIGMDEDEIRVALSTFGQVDSGLNRKHEGTGLGLPLTKGLIERHGGTLIIESEKGVGTRVTLTLPKSRIL